MTRIIGTFTTLRRNLAPMEWAEIVTLVAKHAQTHGIRWDDAARELAIEERTRESHAPRDS